jgi:16S rRNA (guanine966-N2)-methyltransferase
MRIISGKFRGRLIEGTSALTLRPTTDRAREAIFSSLESRLNLEELKVLDLYAGTGALGMEALSRGALSCVFVEKSLKTCKTLSSNLARFGLESQSSVECMTAKKYLEKAFVESAFDLVLADPPYETVDCLQFLEDLHLSLLLRTGGLVVFEDSRETDFQCLINYRVLTEKKYGKTFVSTLEYTGGNAGE